MEFLLKEHVDAVGCLLLVGDSQSEPEEFFKNAIDTTGPQYFNGCLKA
jgi:hypothetical protein